MGLSNVWLRGIRLYVCALWVCFPLTASGADQFIHLGAFKTAVEYDTNPLMRAPEGTGHMWLGLFQPMYRGYWIPDTRSKLQVDLELRMERSSDQRVIANREDPTVEVFWDYRGKRNDFDLDITSTSAPVRLVEFEDTGIMGTNGTRILHKIRGQWLHEWNDRTEFFLASSYGYTRYERVPLISFKNTNLQFEGRREKNGRLTYVAESKLSYLDPTYNDNSGLRPEEVIPTTLLSGLGGVDWDFTKLWFIEARGGLVATHRTSREFEPNMSLKGVYERPRLKIVGQIARETIPSGFGEFLTGDVLRTNLIYDANSRTEYEVSLSVRKNRKPTSNSAVRAGIFVSYKATPLWTIKSSWEYKQSDGYGTAKGMVTRVTLEFSPG